MISRLSAKIVAVLVNHNIIQDEDLEVYQYGTEILVSSCLTLIITILIGLIFNMVWDASIFIGVFAWLRRKTGGFHADTYFKCNLIYAVVLIVALSLTKLLIPFYTLWMHIMVLLVYLLTTLCFSPVENINKPIDYPTKIECKLKSLLYGIALFGVNTMLWSFMRNIENLIIVDVTFLTIIISIIIEKILKGGEGNEKRVADDSGNSD